MTLKSAHVYFILDEQSNLVKVGYSENVETRIAALRNNTRHPLKLLATSCQPLDQARDLERRIHQLLAETRQYGEWFLISPELDRCIAACTFGAAPGMEYGKERDVHVRLGAPAEVDRMMRRMHPDPSDPYYVGLPINEEDLVAPAPLSRLTPTGYWGEWEYLL